MTRQKEGILDDNIRKYCENNNYVYLKTDGDGFPDCVICCNGRYVAFETKVDNNTLSELQKYYVKKINRAYGHAYEVRSLKEAISILEDIKNRYKV